jgi:hypothetical protein
MFVSDEATLDVGFDLALARLAGLTRNGVLTRVSADAYAAGAPAGAPWRSLSCFGDLITRYDHGRRIKTSRDLGPGQGRFFGPSPRRPRIATLIAAMRPVGRIAEISPGNPVPGGKERLGR